MGRQVLLLVIALALMQQTLACELLAQGAETVDEHCLRSLYQQPPKNWPAPQVDAGIDWQELSALPSRQVQDISVLQRIKLGRELFFDPALSRSRDISCASCHAPELGFSDGRRTSVGHEQRQGRRNAPSVVMSAFTRSPFWDGRTHSLEEQALKPVEDPVEMGFTVDELVERLAASQHYRQRFFEVLDSPVTAAGIADVLADYQRSLLPYDTDFERFMLGDQDSLDERQLRGLHLFRTKARCMNCHHGVALSDDQFHNLGLTYYGRKYEDLGRHEVSGADEDVGRFRTPSLRLVSQTGPWMHNGLFPYLWGVINMYDAGMPQPKPRADQQGDPRFPATSSLIKPLGLTPAEKQDLEAFLRSL